MIELAKRPATLNAEREDHGNSRDRDRFFFMCSSKLRIEAQDDPGFLRTPVWEHLIFNLIME
jgi:hypothetical protein